jgi:hypothetical protein
MPYPGDSGFTQWRDAMKMVARLPGGIPPEFRKRVSKIVTSAVLFVWLRFSDISLAQISGVTVVFDFSYTFFLREGFRF